MGPALTAFHCAFLGHQPKSRLAHLQVTDTKRVRSIRSGHTQPHSALVLVDPRENVCVWELLARFWVASRSMMARKPLMRRGLRLKNCVIGLPTCCYSRPESCRKPARKLPENCHILPKTATFCHFLLLSGPCRWAATGHTTAMPRVQRTATFRSLAGNEVGQPILYE